MSISPRSSSSGSPPGSISSLFGGMFEGNITVRGMLAPSSSSSSSSSSPSCRCFDGFGLAIGDAAAAAGRALGSHFRLEYLHTHNRSKASTCVFLLRTHRASHVFAFPRSTSNISLRSGPSAPWPERQRMEPNAKFSQRASAQPHMVPLTMLHQPHRPHRPCRCWWNLHQTTVLDKPWFENMACANSWPNT